MDIRFDGQKALVTGAGKGIGRETVKALVKCGASVIALSRTRADLDSLLAEIPGIKTVCVDVSHWKATRKAISDLGAVDLLVNNAGIFQATSFLDFSEKQIDEMFDINVKAVFNITQVVARAMVDRGKGGVIVNVSSTLSERYIPGDTVYGASKAALDMLTKAASADLGKHKIRVASVQPTLTWTPLGTPIIKSPGFSETFLPRHTIGKFCDAKDVANAILFLLSDKASMVHGSNLYLDGGFLAN